MAVYEVQGPNGEIYEVEGPDDLQNSPTAVDTGEQALQAAPAADPGSDFSLTDTLKGGYDWLKTPTGRQVAMAAATMAIPPARGLAGAQLAGKLGIRSAAGVNLLQKFASAIENAGQGILGAEAVKRAGAENLDQLTEPTSNQDLALEAAGGTVAGAIGNALPRIRPAEPGVSIGGRGMINLTGGRFGSPVTLGQAVDTSNLAGRTIQNMEQASGSIPGMGSIRNQQEAAIDAYRKARLTFGTPKAGDVPTIPPESPELMDAAIGQWYKQKYGDLAQQAPLMLESGRVADNLNWTGVGNANEFSGLNLDVPFAELSGTQSKALETAIKEAGRNARASTAMPTALKNQDIIRAGQEAEWLKNARAAQYPEIQAQYDQIDPAYRVYKQGIEPLMDKRGGDWTAQQALNLSRRNGVEELIPFDKAASEMFKPMPNSGTYDRAAMAALLGSLGVGSYAGGQAAYDAGGGPVGAAGGALGAALAMGSLMSTPFWREAVLAISKLPQGAARDAAMMQLYQSAQERANNAP